MFALVVSRFSGCYCCCSCSCHCNAHSLGFNSFELYRFSAASTSQQTSYRALKRALLRSIYDCFEGLKLETVVTAALLGNLFVRCVVLFVEAFMDNYNLMLFAVSDDDVRLFRLLLIMLIMTLGVEFEGGWFRLLTREYFGLGFCKMHKLFFFLSNNLL